MWKQRSVHQFTPLVLNGLLECCAFALLCCGTGCTRGDLPTDGNSRANLNQSSGSTTSTPVRTADTSETPFPHWAGQRTDEPFDVKEYLISRSAPQDNAAPLYLSALTPICPYLAGGEDSPLEEEIRELANIEQLADGTIPLQRVEDVLLRTAPVLERIDAAQTAAKCVFVTGLRVDSVMPHALALQTVTRLSVLQLRQAQQLGDFHQIEAAIQRALRVSRDLQPRGHEACQLVSVATEQRILAGIERLTLADPGLTAPQLDRLLTLLDMHSQLMLNRAEEGLKMHYIVSRNCIEDLRSGRLTYDEIMDCWSALETASSPTEQSDDSRPPDPPRFNWDAEIAACNELFRQAFAVARHPTYCPDSLEKLRQEVDRRDAEFKQFARLYAFALPSSRAELRSNAPSVLHGLWMAPVESLVEVRFHRAAQLAATEALLMVRRYQVVHGRSPDNLQEAAAESALGRVPSDPFDGKPIRMAVISGKLVLYSVGKDCIDDGGQVDWKFGQQPGDYLLSLPAITTGNE